MFILGNLLIAAAQVLHLVIFFLYLVLIFQAVISWVNPDPYNPIVRTLHAITEPILGRLRARFPFLIAGTIDFTPLAALLALLFVDQFLVATLRELGHRLH
ncbi:MAG: YggT family protein [Nitrospirae bacterium]|nr:MAG: YggT family protein [Nitrospirota bacterium]